MLEQLNRKSIFLGAFPQEEAEKYIDPRVKYSHTAIRRGYVKKDETEIYYYRGNLGQGFMLADHNTKSNSFVEVRYYLLKKE